VALNLHTHHHVCQTSSQNYDKNVPQATPKLVSWSRLLVILFRYLFLNKSFDISGLISLVQLSCSIRAICAWKPDFDVWRLIWLVRIKRDEIKTDSALNISLKKGLCLFPTLFEQRRRRI